MITPGHKLSICDSYAITVLQICYASASMCYQYAVHINNVALPIRYQFAIRMLLQLNQCAIAYIKTILPNPINIRCECWHHAINLLGSPPCAEYEHMNLLSTNYHYRIDIMTICYRFAIYAISMCSQYAIQFKV